MPISDQEAQDELAIERGTTYTAPSDRYFALLSAVPDGTTADALSKEVSAGDYTRVTYASSTGNWSAPAQPGGSGTPWQISNSNVISWGNAGSDWGAVAAFAEFDSATVGAGDLRRWWQLTPSISVVAGQLVEVAASAAIIEKTVV